MQLPVEAIKTAASGRWPDLLADVGGLPREALDGRNHPCPKCGGTDRFRMIDEAAGAVLCNQCFREKNGDGIAAIMWARGLTFEDTVRQLAERLNVPIPERKKRKAEEHLVFNGFVDSLVSIWCRAKPGVTIEAVAAAGGQIARFRNRFTVVAVPILSPNLTAVGHVIWESSGAPLTRRDGTTAKMLVTTGSRAGWIGKHGLEHLAAAEVVWKTEGPTDLMALWSLIPADRRDKEVVLSNAFGAGEKPRPELIDLLRGKTVFVVADNDDAGRRGAARWAGEIAQLAASCKVVNLPAADGLKDVRDFVNVGRTYAQLVELAAAAPAVFGSTAVPPGTTAAAEASAPPFADLDAPIGVVEADDDPSRLAIAFLKYKARRILSFQEDVYWWSDGRWIRWSDDEVRTELTRFLRTEFQKLSAEATEAARNREGPQPKACKTYRGLVSSTIDCLRAFAAVPADTQWGTEIVMPDGVGSAVPTKRRNMIAVENGILDVDQYLEGNKDCLGPHRQTWWSTTRLPFKYDPTLGAAARPKFEKFLKKNLEGDEERIATLQEWAGYCLIHDTSMQRFLVIEGEGANGKSVYCSLLIALLGEDNVSHVPLEIWAERFALTPTIGKLANISSDVGELDKVGEGYLKSFVSGDPMTFDRKGKDPVNTRPTARLMIATNNRPRFSDRSRGIWRRMLLVPFRVEIKSGDRVYGMDLPAFWSETGELSAIFNWALEGLWRLNATRRFTVGAISRAALESYETEVNPCRAFLVDHYVETPSGMTPCVEAYKAYSEWCEASGHRPYSDSQFGKEVVRAFPGVTRTRLRDDGSRSYFYRCLEKS